MVKDKKYPWGTEKCEKKTGIGVNVKSFWLPAGAVQWICCMGLAKWLL